MLSLADPEAMQAVLAQPMEAALRARLSHHIAAAVACGCEHLTHILVCDPGDTEEDFLQAAGFSPFRNPVSEKCYGEDGFEPHWDWAACVDGWFEWLTCIGNDGFARIVLVSERVDTDPILLAMLREHVGGAVE